MPRPRSLSPRAASPFSRTRRASSICSAVAFVSSTHGRSSNRGSERNTEHPASPSSPSPMVAWRSRLAPSGVCESLRCSEPMRSRPTCSAHSSSVVVHAVDGPEVVARREQVARVEADAEPFAAAGGLQQGGELAEGPPERATRAGGVLEVQRAAVGLGERLLDHLAGALDRRRRPRRPAPTRGAARPQPHRACRRRSATR